MRKPSILIDRDAYFYLLNESRLQRGSVPLTSDLEVKIWKGVRKIGEKALVDKDSLGGGDGTRNGYWTSWSLDFIKGMLFNAGFSFENGPVIEYMNP